MKSNIFLGSDVDFGGAMGTWSEMQIAVQKISNAKDSSSEIVVVQKMASTKATPHSCEKRQNHRQSECR